MLIFTHAFFARIFSRITYTTLRGSTFIPASILNAEKKHSPDLSRVSDSKLRRQRLRKLHELSLCLHPRRSASLRVLAYFFLVYRAYLYIVVFILSTASRRKLYALGIKQCVGKSARY